MASKTISDKEQAEYIPIIDNIFASSDLSLVSVKVVRQGLERKLGLDLSARKSEINDLIKGRFDKALEEQDTGEPNGVDEHTEEADHIERGVKDKLFVKEEPIVKDEVKDEPSGTSYAGSASPVSSSKKRKKSPATDNDAKLAAELHAQLNGGRASRNTRKKSTKQKPAAKGKRAKKKSADVVDSDLSGEERAGKPEKKRRKPNNAFNRPQMLAEPLAALVGGNQLSRPECVKRIWAHVKEHDLQDPADRRTIICDEMMKPVFGNRVNMFTMNKVLSNFMYKTEDVADPAGSTEVIAEVKDEVKSEEVSDEDEDGES